ncbi:MAG: THUMP domain-containing protein [Bacteroidaceae bacterium]|nr:THUMP domain-containing protein [Bacteroidaceae bacterium]
MEQTLIAKTFMGLEPVLAQELNALGAKDVQEGRRMVSFSGDKEMMYRANFSLHTAIRILKPIKTFKVTSADEVYEEIKKIDWGTYLIQDRQSSSLGSFAVDAVVYGDEFRHSKYVAYKVKDAICDQFREKLGKRPNISVDNPDLRIHIHIAEDEATLCLDSSGESLHKRGYRQAQVEAPLNEVLAAGMIMLTGWKGDCDFIDPMCGSGTILIEAALIALNMSPGLFRKEYAFEKWPDFDRDLFEKIYNDDSQEREFNHKIYGYDIDMTAVQKAIANVRSAGLTEHISVEQKDFKDFEYNGRQQNSKHCVLVTNPPYGERISTQNLLNTYKMIGERFKHQFMGCDAWVLSYREDCFGQIGLRPSIKFPLYNGSLECMFNKYQIFDGKLKKFRQEGGSIKTDEERHQMAKRKFKSRKKPDFTTMENVGDEIGKIRLQQSHDRWKQKQFIKRQLEEDDEI